MAGIHDDDEKYKDIEALGTLLKNTREAKGLSREEVGRWILDEEKVRSLEEGKEGDFWEIRQLAGRLRIPSAMTGAYLNPSDRFLHDLESETEHDISFWRYGKAEENLALFYEYCNRKNVAMMQLYYRLYAQLLIRQNRREDKRVTELQDFVEKNMPDFEKCLRARKVFSTDELALIAAYYVLVEKEADERLKKLYFLVYYFREVFAKEEYQHPFYARLMFACAQNQYRLGDYANCVEQCLERIQVTKYFRRTVMGGGLCELMADAKGEMLKKEFAAAEEETSMIGGEREQEQRVRAILYDYECANALYRYCFGYKEEHKKELERKIAQWRAMTGQNL